MYKIIKDSSLSLAHKSGALSSCHYFDYSSKDSIYVLAYHRVDWEHAQPHLDPKNLSATPEQFDQQMRLLSNEYHLLTVDELLAAALHNKKLPARSVLVTVDDGYLDFKAHIWPIAKRHGIRPVLFVPTVYVGTGVFWWDKLHDSLQHTYLSQIDTPVGTLSLKSNQDRQAAFTKLADYMKQSPFDKAFIEINSICKELFPGQALSNRTTLDWDDLRELALDGVVLAPHTHSHPALGNISLEQAKFEILESQRLITSEIGSSNMLFAYPYGSSSAIGTTVGYLLRSLGFTFAFTMRPGRANLLLDDPMYLPRIPIYPKMSLAQLHAKLTPFSDIFSRRN